ncbi:hypothetical protein TRVA0_056S00958 [Trichomonascus vanleenenianus]|uniref:uncharacterized protein n=1 Tax=Trichomonascus vanleenenianus TaxID=2268995 RepID=UPI003EC97589
MYRDYLSASSFSIDPLTTETSNYTCFHQSAAADSSPGYAGCFSMSPNFKGPSGGDGGLLQVLGLNSPSETSPISSPMLNSSIVDECLSPLQNLELFCNRLKSTSCDGSLSSHSCPDLTRDATENLDDVDNDDDKSDVTDTLGNFLSRMKQIPIPRYTNSTATLIQLTDSGTKSGEVKYLPTSCTTATKNKTAAEVTAMELESMKAWTANLERKFNDMDTFEIKLKDRIDEVPSPLMPVSANLSTERKTGSAKIEAKEPNHEISLASKLLKNGPFPERSRKAITWIKLKKERTSRKVWLTPGNECTKSFEKGIKRIGLMMKLNSKKKP